MKWKKEKLIPVDSIANGITEETVKFAEEFGTHLARKEDYNKKGKLVVNKNGTLCIYSNDLKGDCVCKFVKYRTKDEKGKEKSLWKKLDGKGNVIKERMEERDKNNDDDAKVDSTDDKLTTSQLRRFFGEVKRQQSIGYKESSFVLIKPKLAYAVGRAKKDSKSSYNKIEDLYYILSNAIDIVIQEEKKKEKAVEESQNEVERKKALLEKGKHLPFKNFISIFEAIVAYHKAAE